MDLCMIKARLSPRVVLLKTAMGNLGGLVLSNYAKFDVWEVKFQLSKSDRQNKCKL